MLKRAIETILCGKHLDSITCENVIEEILDPNANALQIAAFLALLRYKGETVEELCAMVNVLDRKMIPVFTHHDVLDMMGTGGDGHGTVNISTGSSILAAACGMNVAKHGNRSVSSLTGSADVLEALGVNIHETPENIAKSIDEIGIGFCFAPNFHPIMQTIRPIRKALSIRTMFNYLGCLLNPAHAAYKIVGVSDPASMHVMAEVLQKRCKRALVVHGSGLDEISTMGPIQIIEVNKHEKKEFILNPVELGFKKASLDELRGGDAHCNAVLLRDVFKGKQSAISDTFVLNAASALYISGKTSSFEEGVSIAETQLKNGAAFSLLTKWVEYSHGQSIG